MLVTAHKAGPAGIGVWSMALAIQGYALHLGELGLRSVVTAEAIRTRGGARALVPGYLALRLTVSAAVVAAALALVALLLPDHLALMGVVLLSLVPIALQLDWVSLVDGRNGWAGLPLVARPAAFLLAILAWPAPLTPLAIALAFLGSWIFAALLAALPLGLPGRVGGDEPAPPRRSMLRAGLGFAAVTLLAQLPLSADLLVVGWSLGVEAAGLYYLATAIAVAATVLANAAGQLALARAGATRGRQESIRQAARGLAATGTAAGAAAALLLLLGGVLLPLALGPTFAAAGTLLAWLAPWVVLVHMTTPLQAMLGAAGRQRGALRANLAMAILLAPLLGLAAWLAEPWAFALARAVAEAARLALLAHAAGLIVAAGPGHTGGRPAAVRISRAG